MADADELRALVARIETTFGRDVDAWLTCFDDPFVVLAQNTVVLPHTEGRVGFQAMFERLAGRGFASTGADDVRVRVVDETLAFVDAAFTRRRADGSELERVGAVYVARRRPDDGWRFAAIIPRSPEVAVLGDPSG